MRIERIQIEELLFEPKDTEIFKIPDTKTRIATVQNYFFPRLDILLKHTCDLIQQVYGVNLYERMTFVYKPSNRKNAQQPSDFEMVYIGLSGKRRTDRPLTIKKRNGKPFFFHPSGLSFILDLQGAIGVQFAPFLLYVDDQFVESVGRLMKDNLEALTPVLTLNHVSHSGASAFVPLEDILTIEGNEEHGVLLFSPYHFFPVDISRNLDSLILAFVALYPLLDSCVSIGEGELPRLAEMLEQFKHWYLAEQEEEEMEETKIEATGTIYVPQLDSYSFVRAGLWWTVLARDNWTCCSCGRSSREDGVTLEVDHIIPRSKGGTNEISNLQTLCKKCNVGKSNKDNTDLRRVA